MSQDQGSNVEGNQTEQNKAKSAGWWKRNANWLSAAMKIAAVIGLLLLLLSRPWVWWNDPPGILGLIFASYLLLTAGLLAIWLFGIPLSPDENADPESLSKTRIHGTLAILGMVTLLGIVLSIAWTTIEYHNKVPTTIPGDCPVASCTTENITKCECPGSGAGISVAPQAREPALPKERTRETLSRNQK